MIELNGIMIDTANPDDMYAGWQTVEKMAWHVIARFKKTHDLRHGMTDDDLYQICYIAYHDTLHRFEQKDMKLTNYIYNMMYWYLQNTNKNGTGIELSTLTSLDELLTEDEEDDFYSILSGGDAREEAEDALESEELKSFVEKVLAEMSDKDQRRLKGYYIDGKSMQELATADGVSEQAISSNMPYSTARLIDSIVTDPERYAFLREYLSEETLIARKAEAEKRQTKQDKSMRYRRENSPNYRYIKSVLAAGKVSRKQMLSSASQKGLNTYSVSAMLNRLLLDHEIQADRISKQRIYYSLATEGGAA